MTQHNKRPAFLEEHFAPDKKEMRKRRIIRRSACLFLSKNTKALRGKQRSALRKYGGCSGRRILACDARDPRSVGNIRSLGSFSANSLDLRSVERLIVFLLCFVYSCRHLHHLTTTLEDRALLNDQGRCLYVAIHFCGSAKFKALSGNNIAVDGAMYDGDRYFDIGINFSIGTDDERATARADAS